MFTYKKYVEINTFYVTSEPSERNIVYTYMPSSYSSTHNIHGTNDELIIIVVCSTLSALFIIIFIFWYKKTYLIYKNNKKIKIKHITDEEFGTQIILDDV